MSIEKFRQLHPRFTYDSFSISRDKDSLSIAYVFTLEPDIRFKPQLSIPVAEEIEAKSLEPYVFALGLVELISYWKSACAPEIHINAGSLNKEQHAWLKDLIRHGLGEFYFTNQIDFRAESFVTVVSSGPEYLSQAGTFPLPTEDSDLVLVGGGKDSLVTLELLKGRVEKQAAFLLNPIRASLDSANDTGYKQVLIARRKIDPALIGLNKKGYLNGHTPFSAYLAFLGVLVARANNFKNVIASNEASASEGNTEFHGLEINHQYSKSFRFEELFRKFCSQYLDSEIEYFSFLRPLHDIQICKLFSNFPRHFSSFRSCNAHQQKDSWCCACPKCAFVYLCLSPFLDLSQIEQVFGSDLMYEERIYRHLSGLLGLEEVKPLECVGTIEESRLAFHLLLRKRRAAGVSLPEEILALEQKLEERNYVANESLLSDWNSAHFLDVSLEKGLREELLR